MLRSKMRPEQPGGMAVPHQDKLIYDRLKADTGNTETAAVGTPAAAAGKPITPAGGSAAAGCDRGTVGCRCAAFGVRCSGPAEPRHAQFGAA